MTLDFFAERDRLRALDRARHNYEGDAPLGASCYGGTSNLPCRGSKETGRHLLSSRCESGVAPSLAHGRVTGRPWGTACVEPQPIRSCAQSRRYSLDPHRALAWWARRGGAA